MSGLQVALEVLKYVLPLLMTLVLSLVVAHFNDVKKRLTAAEAEGARLLERLHGLEVQVTADRGKSATQVQAAVSQMTERLATKFVSTGAFLTSQGRLEETIGTLAQRLEGRT